MQRDNGWINTLLAEAENERMHLLTFMNMRKPGPLFRGAVIVAQGLLCNMFFLAYLASPKTCHAAVGYLEEEAVKTYTHALKVTGWGGLGGL
jgi:threonyl-tRNA synthetase